MKLTLIIDQILDALKIEIPNTKLGIKTMKEIIAYTPRKKERLLTGAQRKALTSRVLSHANELEWKFRRTIESEKESVAVTKARQIVEKWENEQEKKIAIGLTRMRDNVKQITRNLLFDSVESSLLQVDEFEERKAI